MTLHINNEHPQSRISRRYLEKRIKKILRVLGKFDATLGVTFVNRQEISRLNYLFLNKKGSTDVLSFPLTGPELLGDIVVCVDVAQKQAIDEGRSFRDQCLVLIIHGILHLVGYDHGEKKSLKKMGAMEERLSKIVFGVGYSMLLGE